MKHSAHGSFDLSDLTPAHAAAVRRVFALGGIRGGDGDDALDLDALLAQVDGIADLSDADLATLDENLVAAVELLAEEARTNHSDDALASAIRAADARDSVCGEAAARYAHAEEVATGADSVLERIGLAAEANADGGDDENDGGADDANENDGGEGGDGQTTEHTEEHTEERTTETERTTEQAEGEVQPIAAAAPPASRVAARRPASTQPRATRTDRRMALRASANVDGMRSGDLLDTPDRLFRAFDGAIRASDRYQGPRQQVTLASLGAWDPVEIYGADRTLGYNPRENEERILALTSQSALRASGGICAPPPIDYSRPMLGDDSRPVKNALLNMGADRGGVQLFPAVTMADVNGAVGIWTHANDVTPSSPATKPCAELDCPAATTTLVDAITRCVTIGNFRARYSPEQVSAWLNQIGVLWARTAETKILTKIGDLSTQVTAGGASGELGSSRDILRALALLAVGVRSRNRLARSFPIRVIAPFWLLDNMREDQAAQAPGDNTVGISDAQIEAFFTVRNINITWTNDGEAGQVFTAQGNNQSLNRWPATARLYAFPEGSWVYLDGGTLDFGTTRDSVLNSTNDLQIFSEGFENVAFHGVESHQLDVTICASGATALGVDTADLCTDFS